VIPGCELQSRDQAISASWIPHASVSAMMLDCALPLLGSAMIASAAAFGSFP